MSKSKLEEAKEAAKDAAATTKKSGQMRPYTPEDIRARVKKGSGVDTILQVFERAKKALKMDEIEERAKNIDPNISQKRFKVVVPRLVTMKCVVKEGDAYTLVQAQRKEEAEGAKA